MGIAYRVTVRLEHGREGERAIRRELSSGDHLGTVSNVVDHLIANLIIVSGGWLFVSVPVILVAPDAAGLPRFGLEALALGLVLLPTAMASVAYVWRLRYRQGLRKRPRERLDPEDLPSLLRRGSVLSFAVALGSGLVLAGILP